MVRDHIDTRFNLQLQPIGENNTKDVQSKFNRNELSSRSMLGRLRSPDRDDSVQNTGADSVDETRYRILASVHVVAAGCIYLPQIIQSWFWAEHCRLAPTIAQTAPAAIDLILPIRSPNQPPNKPPNNVPK